VTQAVHFWEPGARFKIANLIRNFLLQEAIFNQSGPLVSDMFDNENIHGKRCFPLVNSVRDWCYGSRITLTHPEC
jgi:hypothetical protein